MARRRWGSRKNCCSKVKAERTLPLRKKKMINQSFFKWEQLKARELARDYRSPFLQLREYIIFIICLLNLSLQYEQGELWTFLLSMMCGIIVPQPKYKKATVFREHKLLINPIVVGSLRKSIHDELQRGHSATFGQKLGAWPARFLSLLQ